jgi:(E)-4-hydroxy-3-methylbut-2-enyl-diphosphate synthase
LIADVHFNPEIAYKAAEIVDKLRINPGNFAEKNNEPGSDHNHPLHIRKLFLPLLTICKMHGTALRLGANHGSLSPRIIDRYGNTPLGMVQSVMEYLKICMEEKFYDIVVSLKSSNTRIMVQANRLMVKTMVDAGMYFPLHLGVTEAGMGLEGRVRSAIGTGVLLLEGIGDTIRVSLTEPPEHEIPFAGILATKCTQTPKRINTPLQKNNLFDPFSFQKRKTTPVLNIGGSNFPVIVAGMNIPSRQVSQLHASDLAPEYVYHHKPVAIHEPGYPAQIIPCDEWEQTGTYPDAGIYPLVNATDERLKHVMNKTPYFLALDDDVLIDEHVMNHLKPGGDYVWVIRIREQTMATIKQAMARHFANTTQPVIFRLEYMNESQDELLARASSVFGSVLLDGTGDGIWIDSFDKTDPGWIMCVAFSILQSSRVRMTRPDYISCPSCGRTLFDIQSSVEKIKKKTAHLKGIKIAVMGCIVNGPGEMADADYGYIGAARGKITLYKNKKPVKQNIPQEQAIDELIQLIKASGDWIENRG